MLYSQNDINDIIQDLRMEMEYIPEETGFSAYFVIVNTRDSYYAIKRAFPEWKYAPCVIDVKSMCKTEKPVVVVDTCKNTLVVASEADQLERMYLDSLEDELFKPLVIIIYKRDAGQWKKHAPTLFDEAIYHYEEIPTDY